MEHLKVKNWEKYQHYKDRNPPWIKLHRDILSDRKFMQLSMESKGLLMCLWVIAAEDDGYVLYNTEEISFRLRIEGFKLTDLDILINEGFLILTDQKEDFKSPWNSRYISPEIKLQAMKKANNKCVFCNSENDLEYDHIVPISQGGKSIIENIQVLCRSCNRKKRAYVAGATQIKTSVADDVPETEAETEAELVLLHNTCPQQKIVDLWREILPELPQPKSWDGVRQQNLRTRWKEDVKRQDLEWWRKFFGYIRSSPFLMGQVDPRPGHTQFYAKLDWVVKKANFEKIREGNYHRGIN